MKIGSVWLPEGGRSGRSSKSPYYAGPVDHSGDGCLTAVGIFFLIVILGGVAGVGWWAVKEAKQVEEKIVAKSYSVEEKLVLKDVEYIDHEYFWTEDTVRLTVLKERKVKEVILDVVAFEKKVDFVHSQVLPLLKENIGREITVVWQHNPPELYEKPKNYYYRRNFAYDNIVVIDLPSVFIRSKLLYNFGIKSHKREYDYTEDYLAPILFVGDVRKLPRKYQIIPEDYLEWNLKGSNRRAIQDIRVIIKKR